MNTQLAIVTGASSGIGYELAAICAREEFGLLVAADRPAIHEAAERLAEQHRRQAEPAGAQPR